MINKILIANRGEIAVRIIRACKELGLATVAVYSTADKESLHVMLADESVCIGSPDSRDSYLNIPNILNAACNTGADAIHPGFGFLAENATFAQMCQDCHLKWIGPTPEAIALLGDKSQAKKTMIAAGIPVIPGSVGIVNSLDEAKQIAEQTGFPLLIKAAAGGGGRGIRRVDKQENLQNAFEQAKLEAKMFFGDDGVYIEKFMSETFHIEFQILADEHENYVHIGERDCSMQRRNQKVLEECPSSKLSPELRQRMGETAVRAAKAAKYTNAGTVEFLLDRQGNFYFMEMNTRIQVEHPITEEISRIDIVTQQIAIANGFPLPFTQNDINFRGHAIECRINSENPEKDFMPTGGQVDYLHVPNGFGVRFDSHIYQGYKLPMNYDSMMGKLIVWGETREIAIRKMHAALDELVIAGVDNNIEFQMNLIETDEFKKGTYNTSFLGKFLKRKI